MSEKSSLSKKNTVVLVINWVFGLLFTLIGIISIFTDPIQGIVMLIMAAALLPPVTNLIEKKWKFHLSAPMKIAVLVIGLIIIGATVEPSSISPEQKNNENMTSPQQEKADEEIEQDESSTQAVIEEEITGLKFEEGTPVDGAENYVANKGGAVVQLLGPGDNLSGASIIALLGGDAGENMLTLAMVIGFSNVMDESSVDWISEKFQEVASNPTKEYSNSRIFGDKLFEVNFTPSDYFNSFTLEIKSTK
jgi:energy-coupling factor transporter transmembrane protein EcfT